LSIIANFLWLPYYPWWSVVIIGLDVVVIWAVTTWDTGRDAAYTWRWPISSRRSELIHERCWS
jgi:hypothetical protein